jgi:hypothetical protein
MADSPVGAAGWILEKFGKWADLPTTADGAPDIWSKFSEEELLTNIMLYMAPASFVTTTWIYYGSRLEESRMLPAGTRIQVRTGFAAFPDPLSLPPPRSFAEKTYNIVHWTDMPRGGHFAALEEPELMLADLRAFIATVSGARSPEGRDLRFRSAARGAGGARLQCLLRHDWGAPLGVDAAGAVLLANEFDALLAG